MSFPLPHHSPVLPGAAGAAFPRVHPRLLMCQSCSVGYGLSLPFQDLTLASHGLEVQQEMGVRLSVWEHLKVGGGFQQMKRSWKSSGWL